MRLREFDEKEQLLKANEKLTKYKTAAGANAAAADASGNFARGNTRFKGINRATKKQFANDAKLAKLKEFADQGVAEAFANPGSGSTGTSRGAKRIANTVRKALAKNSETPDQIAARKDFEAQTDARMRQKKKEQGVAEGSESDAYGNTGEKHECGSCDGTGIDTHDDVCPECGGKGWVRDKESSKKKGVAEDWQKANKRDKTDGMSQKAVNAYRRENPGSKLKTAVTTKPGKLKKGGKASKRRKSYCSRSRGQMKMHSISCAKTPDKAICKARRRWNC